MTLPTFSHSAGDTYSDQSICGPVTVSLTPVTSLLAFDEALNQLVLSLTSESDIGSHEMTLTASLDNYSASESFVFVVEISCPNELISSNLVTPLEPLLFYIIGVDGIVNLDLPQI